jgi:chromate reductase, NAD(P)H dehydrogenase (quinone)
MRYVAPVETRICGYRQDSEGDWIAELECGHTQHVRHRPPWQVRPWVTTPEGRESQLSSRIDCPLCDRGEPVPAGVAEPSVRILAVCGSLQAKSRNSELVELARSTAPRGVEVVSFDGLRDLPHFDPDLEAGGELEPVRRWRSALSASDAVLIACPEYGHSLPGVLKNAIDWVIGSGELERKVVAITAAVPSEERGRRGLQALADTLNAVRATIVGGEPIARGPDVSLRVAQLLANLVAVALRARAEKT